MSIAIDVVILVVCAVVIIKAARSGFIKSVMGLLRGITAFVAAYAFTPLVGGFIKEKFVLGSLSGNISDTIRSLSDGSEGAKAVSELFTEMPDALGQIMDRYGADADKIGKAVEGASGKEAAVKAASDAIADPIAATISNCIAFILIFIAVFLVLVLLTAILDAVFHLPVLNGVNKAFGILFGVAEALLLAWVISFVAAEVMKALGSVDPNTFGEQVIEKSIVTKFFLSINLLGVLENVLH